MKLYIGNMPFSMGESELRELFTPHGEVTSADIILDRDTGRPRGFAFVEMDDDGARKAISALNEHEVDGRSIKVSEARPRGQGGGGRRY